MGRTSCGKVSRSGWLAGRSNFAGELPHKSIVNNRKSLKLPDRPFPSSQTQILSTLQPSPAPHCELEVKYILAKAQRAAGVM